MPGINVIDSDGGVQRFPDANSWHVDDRGQLHLKSNAGPVASFAKDCWQGASTEDETGPAVKRTTLDDVLAELHAIHGTLLASQGSIHAAVLAGTQQGSKVAER